MANFDKIRHGFRPTSLKCRKLPADGDLPPVNRRCLRAAHAANSRIADDRTLIHSSPPIVLPVATSNSNRAGTSMAAVVKPNMNDSTRNTASV